MSNSAVVEEVRVKEGEEEEEERKRRKNEEDWQQEVRSEHTPGKILTTLDRTTTTTKPGDQAFQLAAAYVCDAQYARNIPFQTGENAIWCYHFYTKWVTKFPMYLFLILDLALALVESPAIPGLEWPFWASMLVELLCLVAFTGRLVHLGMFTERRVFWRDGKNICVVVAVIVTAIDMVVYLVLTVEGHWDIRWSRVLRPIFAINFSESRQLRRAFCNIRRTLLGILSVFILFLFSIATFSLLALKLFGNQHLTTHQGSPYFDNYLNALFDLYVLVTTANSPDIMMPAYNKNRWYSLFFIVYIVVNTYLFMSIFLAVVYNGYRKHLKNEVRTSVFNKRRSMACAFQVLCEPVDEDMVMSQSTWLKLVRVVAPTTSESHRMLLWQVSDEEHQGYIGKRVFTRLADLLNIEVVEQWRRPHPLENCAPRVYNSWLSCLVRHAVHHRFFRYFFDVVIFVNAIFIATDDTVLAIQKAEWVFLALYLVEILLKLYTYEPRAFFSLSNFWNWFDTLIVLIALIYTMVVHSSSHTTEILDFLFILRVLRLLRIVDTFHRLRVVMQTLINIGPTMVTFAALIMVFYYSFAILGMELFHGKVQFFPTPSTPEQQMCGNPLLVGSEFVQRQYCKNNFNDIVSASVLLVQLTVVNQWHVLASGFVITTDIAARLYFIVFHMIVVILIINIFIAFVLEAFILEYTLDKGKMESAIERKIQELGLGITTQELENKQEMLIENMEHSGNELGKSESDQSAGKCIMFKISEKRYRTVNALLQRMFEQDLADEPEDQVDAVPCRFTLDGVL
uniref:two pore channel protein 2-like n=1 Tax=Myxine glutinosa TaxID=7769 RepID=UPI00358EE697